MIDFMVIAAPRSGTAWCSNWLTTETSLCVHDPLFEHSPETWDSIPSDRQLGCACTGIATFPKFLRHHPARKVVLHRDMDEVNLSLHQMGLSRLHAEYWTDALRRVDGLHVHWRNLWENPRPIWEHLMRTPFDAARHELLCKLNVQMDFERVKPNPAAVRRMFSAAGL